MKQYSPKPYSARFRIWVSKVQVWAAANGGVTNGGLRGVWPPFPEIGRNRPFSPFFCLFRPFPEGLKSTWKIQKTEEKGLFPQISSDFLKPPFLKPPFAAPHQVSEWQLSGQVPASIRYVLTTPLSQSPSCGRAGPRKDEILIFQPQHTE